MPKRLTTEEFIERSIKVHGNKYDYSKVNYVNAYTKVCIICPIHGEFIQNPYNHMIGVACRKCIDKSRTLDTNTFILRAQVIHGDRYDYSKVDYINNNTKVCIICPDHGEFWQLATSHINLNLGCIKCQRSNTSEFIKKSKVIHGDRYDYSKVDYINNNTKVCIICPEHGEFWQIPNGHLHYKGCSKCKNSKGEIKIRTYLDTLNIIYDQEYTFNDCIDKGKLKYDFFIPKYNTLIEFDGIQHYKPVELFGGIKYFNAMIKRDNIKTKYANDNGYHLIRIPYYDFGNIEFILNEYFNDDQQLNVSYTA